MIFSRKKQVAAIHQSDDSVSGVELPAWLLHQDADWISKRQGERNSSPPPYLHGLPVLRPTALYQRYSKLIEGIYSASNMRRDDFERLVRPVILSLARFCGPLAAAEYHHHYHLAGLFEHSLEVGLQAIYTSGNTALCAGMTGLEKHNNEQRIRLSLLFAALLHDIGKVVSDVKASNDKGDTWSPFTHDEPLYDWGLRNTKGTFNIMWIVNRYKAHNDSLMISALVIMLIPPFVRQYLGATYVQQIVEIINLRGNDTLVELLTRADQYSTGQSHGAKQYVGNPYNFQIPYGEFILRALTRLALKYPPNTLGGYFWYGDGVAGKNILWVSWRAIKPELKQEIELLGESSASNDERDLARALVTFGIATPKPESVKYSDFDPYWQIWTSLHKEVPHMCVQIKAVNLILGSHIPSPIEIYSESPSQRARASAEAAKQTSATSAFEPVEPDATPEALDYSQELPLNPNQIQSEDNSELIEAAAPGLALVERALELHKEEDPIFHEIDAGIGLRFPEAFQLLGVNPSEGLKQLQDDHLIRSDNEGPRNYIFSNAAADYLVFTKSFSNGLRKQLRVLAPNKASPNKMVDPSGRSKSQPSNGNDLTENESSTRPEVIAAQELVKAIFQAHSQTPYQDIHQIEEALYTNLPDHMLATVSRKYKVKTSAVFNELVSSGKVKQSGTLALVTLGG